MKAISLFTGIGGTVFPIPYPLFPTRLLLTTMIDILAIAQGAVPEAITIKENKMCTCDLEYPQVFDATERQARKQHRCSDCGWDILPYSKYLAISGLWDGEWKNFKQCLLCHQIGQRYMHETDCCYAIGGLYEELQDSDMLIFDEESQQWKSNVEWLRIASQEPFKCVALEIGAEWVDLGVGVAS